ncbi:Ctr copper transporter [Aspergillus ellipticus CBS 707.79]|uniref:Copper transport protein n=1 Tax=Aspergillus ellipticus CBS 707.79 TaxID=1448320 RepID=A0A319DK69_9EURO|nr:Ctr copper transporter [Aspergillus ellipticus CBS 707.79]
MLWNWNTVDSCFIARSWRITSHGLFAGSCVGVIFLVVLLEFLRRMAKEYDRFLRQRHLRRYQRQGDHEESSGDGPKIAPHHFTPSVLEQAVRAFLHLLQFALAYFVMLLAMYYNGYFIICILIGAYMGSFIFSWEAIDLGYAPLSCLGCL